MIGRVTTQAFASLNLGVNEYLAEGSKRYCQNDSAEAPNWQLALYTPNGVEKDTCVLWPAGGKLYIVNHIEHDELRRVDTSYRNAILNLYFPSVWIQ